MARTFEEEIVDISSSKVTKVLFRLCEVEDMKGFDREIIMSETECDSVTA
jgi:hypothetical protein